MRRVFAAAAIAVLVLAAAPAEAGPAAFVRIKPNVTLVDGGDGALVTVVARCARGYHVLEAFAYVNQDGFSSEFGFFPLQCGTGAQRFTRRVETLDFDFHAGQGTASALVLVENNAGDTADAQDNRQVTLRF